ncbi:MAG: hypothetical protein NDJ92_01795 [Thermoanaerobaculia bacterium]|nr:hypothetical protein [Thermoanaerobaculia bacterium]
MKETYTKRGNSVRIERNGRSISTVVTREHGIATRERGHFRAESRGERTLAHAPDVAGATDVARRLAALGGDGVGVERLTVVAGLAEHVLEGDRRAAAWTEQIARAHLALVNRDRALRVDVELGATSPETLPLHAAMEAADALRLPDSGPLPPDITVELSPCVAAALWRFVAEHPALVAGSRLRVTQSTHPAWPFDGVGTRVEAEEIAAAPAASLYRPSYRIAPVPSWFHVSAELGRRAAPTRSRRHRGARAVALLRPFRLTRNTVSARILVTMGGASTPAELDLARDTFAPSFVRMTGDAIWFPFDAGAWGRATVIEGARLTAVS